MSELNLQAGGSGDGVMVDSNLEKDQISMISSEKK